jgi:tetratricopeptide (TPR) repeat protein
MTNLRIILVSFLLGLAVCTISYAQSDGDLDSQCFEMAYDFDTKGQYDKALEYHQASLEIERSLGDEDGTASSLNNIGRIYHSWSQYDKAKKDFELTITSIEKIRKTATGDARRYYSANVINL